MDKIRRTPSYEKFYNHNNNKRIFRSSSLIIEKNINPISCEEVKINDNYSDKNKTSNNFFEPNKNRIERVNSYMRSDQVKNNMFSYDHSGVEDHKNTHKINNKSFNYLNTQIKNYENKNAHKQTKYSFISGVGFYA